MEGTLAACGSFGTGEVALFPAGPEIWRAQPAERFRVQAFDVDGSTVAFVLSSEASAASSVQEFESFLELADRVVQSVDF